MKRIIIKHKILARILVVVAMFLSFGLAVGGGIVNSDGAFATGMWELNFHSNGGHHGNLPTTQYCTPEEGATTCTYTIPDGMPVRDGYDFMGWATTRDALVPEYHAGDPLTTHACVKDLYAVWGFKLSFDVNGGYGEVETQMCHPVAADAYLDPETLTPADYICDVSIPTTVPTRDDYYFLGWGTENLSVEASSQPGDVVTLNQSTVYYAVWAPIYKAIFNMNDKTGGTNALTCHSTTTTYGECSIVIPETAPTRDGYEFLGWATIDDTTSVAFLPSDILIFGGAGRGEAMRSTKRAASETHISEQTIMLYAVWKEGYLPVPDTGIMTSDGGMADKINNAVIYVAVPVALLVFGYIIKRASTKKVNFTKRH